MFEISDTDSNSDQNVLEGAAKILVIGVGGGGCNAVNTMITAGLTGVEYVVCNTDVQSLKANLAPKKVQLGIEVTRGLGAGANPELGRKAALDEYEKLQEVLEGSDMVFVTAGMGGGTGTGAAPVIAKLATELGALTVGVVTRPFIFEGRKRMKHANMGIENLEENVDSLITIPNQRLLHIAGEGLSLIETFKKADEVLLNAVRGISDLINHTGFINADFADVSTVMRNKGLALMGTGIAQGQNRALKAATEAISSPLLEDITIDGATGIIINITANESLTMHEANEAATLIMDAADEDAEIIFGTVSDDTMGEDIKITVIATGLGGQERVKAQVQSYETAKKSAIRETNNKAELPSLTQDVAPATPAPAKVAEPVREQKLEFAQNKAATNVKKQEHTPKASSLVQTIQEAANRYEAAKRSSSPEKMESAGTPPTDRPIHNNNSSFQNIPFSNHREIKRSDDQSKKISRAKSIAEKLGFINFDEDELDTPSYLRKDDKYQEELTL